MNISIKANRTAKFKCLQTKYVAGITGLQFDWIKWNNIPFAVSKRDVDFGNFTVLHTNSKYTIEPGQEEELDYVSYLSIHNVTQDDIGLYSCVVCNQYGRDSAGAFLGLNTTSGSGWLNITYCTFIHESHMEHFLKKKVPATGLSFYASHS